MKKRSHVGYKWINIYTNIYIIFILMYKFNCSRLYNIIQAINKPKQSETEGKVGLISYLSHSAQIQMFPYSLHDV